ncbi:MAG: sulfotransferase [Thermoguttaceae bacterium]|jgi:hypothetical protein
MATAARTPTHRAEPKAAPPPAEQLGGYTDHWWYPRFWYGMTLPGFLRLLVRNRFQVTPRRWGMALGIATAGPTNWLLWLLQEFLLGRRIAATRFPDDPIFVVGHWRSGTTLLHELLVLDPRFTYPNTYDCFAPNHFLVSAWFFRPLLKLILPKQRPMDNMAAGWDCPQEDEFALCNMGLPSPYLTIPFSNRPPQNQEYFSLDRVSPRGLERWKRGLLWFLKCLTVRSPRQIVVKSPPHMFRIRTLLEMFPNARFVHIYRNPYVIFPSTVNLWKRLYRNEGLQMPRFEHLREHVFETFERMYEVFERDRPLIPPGRFCEVRYEDLVADPIGEMKKVYEGLRLGDFEPVRPALAAYFAEKADYKTNRYQLAPEVRSEIAHRWAGFFQRYGYAAEE